MQLGPRVSGRLHPTAPTGHVSPTASVLTYLFARQAMCRFNFMHACLIAFRQAVVLQTPLHTAPETLMATYKRKRKFAAKLEAARGLIQPAPPQVRKSTKAKRVEQLREQAIAQGMRYTAVKGKLQEAIHYSTAT